MNTIDYEFETWRAGILAFKSELDVLNPFLDVSIKAEFTGPSGQTITREAYWDGNDIYKVSFAPTEAGEWEYILIAPDKSGLNHKKGVVKAVPYTGELPIYKHGFIRVSDNHRFFSYADGTPFFWLGDTHWEFAYKESWDKSNHPQMDSMFKGMADRRVKQGYTVYQTNLRSDKVMHGDDLYWDSKSDTDLPNIEFYQNELDKRMHYIADLGLVNALGQAWFMSIDNDVEHQKNLARYLVARYGALPIVWTLAGECAGYEKGKIRQERLDGWREVAKTIEKLDGYGNLQTAHYTNERPFADYYQDEPWFDFTLNQAGHGDYAISASDYATYMAKHSDKPFVEGEAMYEYCSTLEEMGTRLCTDDMLRRVAYMSIQLGGCGYTYGAQGIWDVVWNKDDPNPMALFNRYGITWAEAIDGPGGYQMGYMKTFYLDNKYWELAPYGIHTNESTFSPFAKKQPFVTVNKDMTNMILYYGDNSSKSLEIKGLKNVRYVMKWFNPRNGEYIEKDEEIYPNDGIWLTPKKPAENDWLLVVEAKI